MDTEGTNQRYLLAREMGIWQAEADRTQNRLDELQQGGSEAAIDQAWYNYCFRKQEEVAWELDMMENRPKHSASTVAGHVSLDDLDRQTG